MNFFDVSTPQEGESFTTLLTWKNVTINRIVSSDHLEERVYCQEEDEWVVLIEGEAEIWMEDRQYLLLKGDMLFIPKQTRHRVARTTKGSLWLTVHID